MRAKTVVIWLAFIMILLALLLGGLWYGRLRIADGKASDPSYGLIASPLNGDIVLGGNPVYVHASFLLSHRDLAGPQLYVDGVKFVLDEETQTRAGQVVPKCSSSDAQFCGLIDARMLWIPLDAGMHTLSVCIPSDDSQGSGWIVCTDEVHVMVADLKAPPETGAAYLPQPGDTLESIAGKFGLPPVLVAAANPGIEPIAELPGEIPVNVPLVESPDNPGSPWKVDQVTMTIDVAVDRAYCYYSLGENYWSRMPLGDQTFVYPSSGRLDLTAEFRSLAIPTSGDSLMLDCWGWSGAALVPLGSGKTTIEPASTMVQLRGDHFVLDVVLESIPPEYEPRDLKMIILPPQGLTSTNKLDVCIDHFPPADFFFGPFACKTAVENGDIILIWEWLLPIFPPEDPTLAYLTKIDGYHVYVVNSMGTPSLIATVSLQDKKTLILPRTWSGSKKFVVRAYAGPLESANSNLYTLGETTSGVATVTIPLAYGYTGGQQKYKTSGFCTTGTGAEINIGGSQLAAGFRHDEVEDSCVEYNWEYSRAQFGFDLAAVKGPLSSAKLSYRQDFTTSPGQSCARELRVVTTTSAVDLKDLSSDPHTLLSSYGYAGSTFNVDVTDAVRDWMLGIPNAGFLFIGRDESLPGDDCGGLFEAGCIGGGSDSCWSRYGDVKLTVTYFTP